MGWAQESSSSVSIQHAHFSIASEILRNQTGGARVRRDPAVDTPLGQLVTSGKAEVGDSL